MSVSSISHPAFFFIHKITLLLCSSTEELTKGLAAKKSNAESIHTITGKPNDRVDISLQQ